MKIYANKRVRMILFFVIALFAFCVLFGIGLPEAQEEKIAESQEESSEKLKTVLDPNDPNSIIYLGTFGARAGTGDPKKSGKAGYAMKLGEGFHPAALKDKNLPLDKYGLINWVKIVADEQIDPRWNIDPNADPDEEPFIDFDILFEAKSDFEDDVIFPHDIHTYWLKCEICHDSVGGAIFNPEAGSNKVLMIEIKEGKWCGRCHDKVAFPLTDCLRCHVRPQDAGDPEDDDLTVRNADY